MIAVLSITAAAQTVHAEDTDIIRYKINNQEARTVTVNGLNATNDTILKIPETTVIDGIEYTVTDIEIGRFRNEARCIQRVIVPKTVTRITRLEIRNMFKVEFAENSTLRVIGDNACSTSQLIEFEIPSTVDSIGSSAFSGASLQRVEIPKGVKKINSSTFSYSAIREIVMHDDIKSIGQFAFNRCKNLKTITIPAATDTIGNNAFSECDSLSNIALPEGLKYLGNSAFSKCVSLREIALPDGLTNINAYTFNGCTMLSSVTLPAELKCINYDTFAECDSLKRITLPASVDSLGYRALRSVTDVYPKGAIPARIGFGAFADNAEIHVDMSQIDAYAGASGWKDYDVHGDEFSAGYLSYIPTSTHSAYVTGNSLPENGKLTVPKTVEHEGYSLDVTAITDHTLPELASEITIDAQVETIGFQKFYNSERGIISNLTRIVLPQTLKRIETNTFIYTDKLKSIELPTGLERIGDYAFYYCSNLALLTIDEASQLSSIGQYAFSRCSSLTSITIPDGVTKIGNYAFSGCSKLTEINYNAVEITDISGYTYYHRVVFQTAGADEVLTVNIGENVLSIPNYMFSEYTPGTYIGAETDHVVINSQEIYNQLTSQSSCGGLIQGVPFKVAIIRVLKSIVDSFDPDFTKNTYLNGADFTRTVEGDYYVYTHV